MITIKHDLDNKYACRKDAGYCGSHNGEEIYIFQIIDIEIKEYYIENNSKYVISIRGEHTCWMDINNFFISHYAEDFDWFVEQKRRERLINSCYKTYDTREL